MTDMPDVQYQANLGITLAFVIVKPTLPLVQCIQKQTVMQMVRRASDGACLHYLNSASDLMTVCSGTCLALDKSTPKSRNLDFI